MAKQKRNQENFRTDELTTQLLFALQQQNDRNKSDLIRSAIYYYAKSEMSQEDFSQVILGAVDLEELIK